MLPVVAGDRETRRQILIYSLILAPLALVPWAMGAAGLLYAVPTALLGLGFVWLAVKVVREPETANYRAAKQLFGYSILYLFLVFALLMAEHMLAAQGLGV
jgi:protoheme IX farnesyltransferase